MILVSQQSKDEHQFFVYYINDDQEDRTRREFDNEGYMEVTKKNLSQECGLHNYGSGVFHMARVAVEEEKEEAVYNKIVRSFQDVEFAKSNSLGLYKDKAFWYWGVDRDNNIYCKGQISGFVFPHDWCPIKNFTMGLSSKDIVTIYKELIQEKEG